MIHTEQCRCRTPGPKASSIHRRTKHAAASTFTAVSSQKDAQPPAVKRVTRELAVYNYGEFYLVMGWAQQSKGCTTPIAIPASSSIETDGLGTTAVAVLLGSVLLRVAVQCSTSIGIIGTRARPVDEGVRGGHSHKAPK